MGPNDVLQLLPKDTKFVNPMNKYPSMDEAAVELDRKSPDPLLVQEIVRAACESGKTIVLEYLCYKELWHPQGGGPAIEAADEAGTLLGLLAKFPLPLARYPSVAESYLMEAVSVFDKINQQGLHNHKRKDGSKPSCGGGGAHGTESDDAEGTTISVTTVQPFLSAGHEHAERDNFRDVNTAQLLANFLSVPSSVAEEAMNHVVEAMVVFNPRECRLPSCQFSSKIRPLFLHQEEVDPDWILARSHASGWMVSPPPVHRVCPGNDILLKLSKLYPLTLSVGAKKELGISIPKKAQNFAFVKPGEGGRHPLGGLAFFDKKKRLTSWVSLSLDRNQSNKKQVALQFLACEDLLESDPQLRSLEKWDLQAVKGWKGEAEQEKFELQQAHTFAWVGPSDLIKGYHLESVMGGFMFFVEGKAMYLRISAAGQADKDKKLVLRSQVDNLTSDSKFPEWLGTLFLDRKMTFTSKQDAIVKGVRFLPPEDSKSSRLTVGKQELLCSSLCNVTMNDSDRRAALIPLKATHFACIYPGEGALDGGFVYLELEGPKDLNPSYTVLAINVHVNQGRHALSFGAMKRLGAEESQRLLVEFTMQPISLASLLETGATHYCFVGSNVKFSETADSGQAGGFAYIFENQEDNRFFPIKGSGEVLDRAVLHGEMNTLVVPGPDSNADSSLICNTLRNPAGTFGNIKSWFWPARFKDGYEMLGSEGTADLVPVRVARLKICDALSPTVLHALVRTPRPQVLHTMAAKAITQVTFDRAWPVILLDAVLEATSLAGVTAVSVLVRNRDNGPPSTAAPTQAPLGALLGGPPSTGPPSSVADEGHNFSGNYEVLAIAFMFMVFVMAKNILTEILLFSGYRRRSWTWDYLNTTRFVLWIHLVLMFRLQFWLGQGWVQGSWSDPREIRPLLAAVGCMKWIRLLYMFRGFERWSFGKRILPIMTSLLEVSTFLMIMFFLLGAYFIAAYSLSAKDVSILQVLLSAYRLNFLSDFDMDTDVYFKTDANDQMRPKEWEWVQLLVFVVASFVIAISMMNIYIGVMSNAFDHHTERVVELFVRARASIGLDHALRIEEMGRWYNFCGRRCGRLRCQRCCCRRHKGTTAYKRDDRERLWICHPQLEQNDSEGITLRGALKTMSVGMREQVDSLSVAVADLSLRLKELEANVPKQVACTTKDCSSRLQPDAKFCCQCGKNVQVPCKCGAQLPPGAKFCPSCGEAAPEDKGGVGAEPTAAPPVPPNPPSAAVASATSPAVAVCFDVRSGGSEAEDSFAASECHNESFNSHITGISALLSNIVPPLPGSNPES